MTVFVLWPQPAGIRYLMVNGKLPAWLEVDGKVNSGSSAALKYLEPVPE